MFFRYKISTFDHRWQGTSRSVDLIIHMNTFGSKVNSIHVNTETIVCIQEYVDYSLNKPSFPLRINCSISFRFEISFILFITQYLVDFEILINRCFRK